MRREGGSLLAFPGINLSAGPGRRAPGIPFHNPGMALNRDLSVLIVQAELAQARRGIDVADALAGTGARSIRIAHECQGDLVVHANDANPRAVDALREAAKANPLPPGRLEVSEADAHAFLAGRRFDVVDLDPHGSPMPFADAAIRATRPGGLVCVTATDTAALAGKFPRACLRRYGAHHGLHSAAWHREAGLRIMAAALVRAAARFERAATPMLMVAQGHWLRVVARVREGSGAADALLARLQAATLTADGRGAFAAEAPPGAAWAGPMWSGPMHDAAFVAGLAQARAVRRTLALPGEVDRLLDIFAQEAKAPAFWLVPDQLQKALGPPPRRDRLILRLQEQGATAARSHLDPQGVRTDADAATLRECWG